MRKFGLLVTVNGLWLLAGHYCYWPVVVGVAAKCVDASACRLSLVRTLVAGADVVGATADRTKSWVGKKSMERSKADQIAVAGGFGN